MYHLISLDAEATELGGTIIAIGATLCTFDGYQWVRFKEPFLQASNPANYKVDPWVAENVVPVLPPPTHESESSLLASFWAWLEPRRKYGKILVDVGFPVEANVYARLLAHDPKRAWLLPTPVIDLASVLFGHGYDGFNTSRREWADAVKKAPARPWVQHDPLCDAEVQACALFGLATQHRQILASPTWKSDAESDQAVE